MSRRDWEQVLIFVVLFAFSCVVLFALVRPESTPQGITYDTRFGQVICAEFMQSDCGVRLQKCHDTREYYCLSDVRREEP